MRRIFNINITENTSLVAKLQKSCRICNSHLIDSYPVVKEVAWLQTLYKYIKPYYYYIVAEIWIRLFLQLSSFFRRKPLLGLRFTWLQIVQLSCNFCNFLGFRAVTPYRTWV
jgi:hypothetical protein